MDLKEVVERAAEALLGDEQEAVGKGHLERVKERPLGPTGLSGVAQRGLFPISDAAASREGAHAADDILYPASEPSDEK